MKMDFIPITNLLLSALWYLIPLGLIATFFKSPWFKGVMEEFQVNLLLKWRLSKDQYRLIKNITLPTEDGSTQIDHVLVSKYGVFVIETKNMKGWIFGSSNQRQDSELIYER